MSHRAFSASNLVLLALTYFCYFGHLGVLVPYLGVFLDGRGFTSEQIGSLTALITLARIIGPNLWASVADRTGQALRVLQLGALLTFVACCSVFWLDGFWGLTLSLALVMMFWTAILPQLEVLTLSCLATGPGGQGRYGRIRLWGSIGYIVLTIVSGKMLDLYSSDAPMYISALALLSLFGATLMLAEPPMQAEANKQRESLWPKIKQPVFIGFILSAALLQFSFGPYYSFFALYARELGYSGEVTGWLIALGVMVEVIIFMLAGRFIGALGVKWILFICMALTSLRWSLLALGAEHIFLLIFSQTLHAFSFGLTHAASIHFIHNYFGKKFQSRGQAIYISVAFGIGGALGSFSAGNLWQQGSGSQLSFLLASAAAFLGTICLLPIARQSMEAKPCSDFELDKK